MTLQGSSGAVVIHGTSAACPRVQSGEWSRCLGHPPARPPRKKRRRVDLVLRLEEAKAALTAVEDVLALIQENGWVEEGQRSQAHVDRLAKVRAKLRAGIDHVITNQGGV